MQKKSSSVTIYDIAREAGVSASTVSRVINNKKGVSRTKRQAIEGLLKKLNYEPDVLARGLVQQSSKIVGILMSDIRTSHHAESAYFMERELEKHGYSCLIINTGFSIEERIRSMRTLASRRVEAVVLVGSTFQVDSMRDAIKEYLGDLPVIIENGYLELPNVYGVLADEENGFADCMRLLVRKGRKNVAFVNWGDTPSNLKKILGFQRACHEAFPKKEPRVVWVEAADHEWQACFDATQRLLREDPQVDGIIYATDLLANAGLVALRRMGLRVPRDVAVIGCDNSIYTKMSMPALTSLDNKMEELSITCSNILVSVLSGEKTAHKMLIYSSIVERESS